MNRLTEKDKYGNWCVKALPWENLLVGQVITQDVWDRLYGCLCKLMEYEDTGLSPEEVVSVNDFTKNQAIHLLAELCKERCKHKWIPVTDHLPETDDYILVSFRNATFIDIGRYEEDGKGDGAFYSGDEDKSYAEYYDLFVNAWMRLPKPYREEED